jgi:hypothetical protein
MMSETIRQPYRAVVTLVIGIQLAVKMMYTEALLLG